MMGAVLMREPLKAGALVAGRYEIFRLLGAGLLSHTYLARDTASPRSPRLTLRVTCLPLEDEDEVQRVGQHVLQEVRRIVALRQKSLPTLHDCFLWEGLPWTVRAFTEGHVLPVVLERSPGPVSETQARGWMLQLCDALLLLHAQVPPFILAGLPPDGIVVSPLGRVGILDYPVPCFLPQDLRWKHARRVAPGYLSPELVRGEGVGLTADVYSLGALHLHLLTQASPQAGLPSRSLLTETRPDVAPGTWALLERALAAESGDRFQSVGEFAAALRAEAIMPEERTPSFDLDCSVVRVVMRPGDLVRRRVHLVAREGELIGRARADCPWLRLKYDAFRGEAVDVEFTVDALEMEPGTEQSGIVHVDTQCGQAEIEVVVRVEAPLGERLSRGVRSWFGRTEESGTP